MEEAFQVQGPMVFLSGSDKMSSQSTKTPGLFDPPNRADNIGRFAGVLATVLFLSACNVNSLVDSTDLPSHIKDPGAVKTTDGALGLYYYAISSLSTATSDLIVNTSSSGSRLDQNFVYMTGILTDELQTVPRTVGGVSTGFPGLDSEIDLRDILERPDGIRSVHRDITYGALQKTRGATQEALGALRKYHPTAPSALQGHLFAIEGISELYLAELYCSGIPLSTIDFESGFTLTKGFTTDEVYTHALARFDSAQAYASDSARLIHLINIGKARANLAMGKFDDASAAAAQVPDEYKYQIVHGANRQKFVPRSDWVTVGNREGINGLPFGSYEDPRTTLPSITNPNSPFTLASGIEARLIQAEADLRAGRSTWIDRLNALRTSCINSENCSTPAPAGTGGVAGLPLLQDPALMPLPEGKDSVDVRVDLLFEERAYWLFLTGRRQADLRRLIRHYGRDQSTVYPIGGWGTAQVALYGNDVTLPLKDEYGRNPLYEGCYNRDA